MICYEQIFLFNGSHNHNNLRIRIINAVIHTVISMLAAYGGKALSNGEKALSNGEKALSNGEKALSNGEKALSNGEKALSKALSKTAIKVIRLLENECGLREIATTIQHSDLTKLRRGIMASLIEAGFVELTQPDSPRSPTQKYRLTEKGRALLKDLVQE